MSTDEKIINIEQKEFKQRFSPKALESVTGLELLKLMAYPKSTDENIKKQFGILYEEEYHSLKHELEYALSDFGSGHAGFNTNFILAYKKNKGAWHNLQKEITLNEAIKLAESIKQEIITACNFLENNDFNGFYDFVSKSESKLFNKVYTHKYFYILYGKYISFYHADSWQKYYKEIFNLHPNGTYYDIEKYLIEKYPNCHVAEKSWELIEQYGSPDSPKDFINYWWISASNDNPFRFCDLEIGKEDFYTIKAENGNPRQKQANFKNIKVGDKFIGYDGSPIAELTAVGEITNKDDEKVYFKKTANFDKNVPLSTISNCTKYDFNDCLDKNRYINRGSLFKLTKEEFDFILEKGRNKMDKPKLNQILYGPPGTGKTYNTVVEAIKILNNDLYLEYEKSEKTPDDYKKLKDRFDELKEDKRIEFITFHQSYSYEEFVEGIKPYIPEWGEENVQDVKYVGKDGIFKKICSIANIADKDFETFFSKLQKYLENNSIDLYLENKKAKITIENAENSDSIKVIPHTEKATANYVQKFELQNPDDINGRVGYAKAILNLMSANYVLIVDEINRGNISKIFGELITLIEEDKRKGADNELSVTLPYSGELFSVPNNLYIIGTMNTADRSIAMLDTALRRRFDFVEMPPNENLLKGKIIKYNNEPINLYNVLKNLNNNITSDKVGGLDKDHKIGHAFLINVDKGTPEEQELKLKRAFLNKIYPLLEEYFYGEEDKIAKVLSVKDTAKDLGKIYSDKTILTNILKDLSNEPEE